MTRVLIVSAMYPSASDRSKGIAVQREAAALRARSFRVDAIGKAPGLRAYGVQAWQAWRALRSDVDIVHAHYGTSGFVAACAGLVRLRPRAPLIVTLHGSDVAAGPRPRLTRYWPQYWLSCLGALAARRVIVQDETMLAVLPGTIQRRAEVLGQGIDPARFLPANERHRNQVLFLGDRRRPVKRFWLAQEAVVAAASPGLELESLDGYAADEIPAVMAKAAVGLLTSEREGMPVAVQEALAAGLRVLAVDLPPLRRVAASFPDLVTLTSADAESVGRALDRLLAAPMPADADRLRALATLSALGWVEPGRTDRLLEIYERVVPGLRSPEAAAIH